MATATRSSRIFEPLVGSDALFLDPTTGTPNQPQSAAAAANPSPANSDPSQSSTPADSQSTRQSQAADQNEEEQVMAQTRDQQENPQKIPTHQAGGDGGNGAGGDTGGTASGADSGSAPAGTSGAGSGGNTASGGASAGGSGTSGGGSSGGGSTDGGTTGGGILGQGGLLDQGGLPTIGGAGDTVGSLGDTVMQTVNSIGSGSPLNILNGSGLLDGLGVNGITDPIANLVNGVVADAGQTVGALGNSGNLDDVLNAVSQGTGSLLDDVLNAAGSAAGSGTVGGIVDGIGNDVVNGAVGGAGLLNGTPLAGLQGDGALISTNLLRGDDSSSGSLLQIGAGTDQSKGLIDADIAGSHNAPGSNNIADGNVGPSTSGNDASANLLGANPDSTASLINLGAGEHQGPTLATIDAGTNADQFSFPALNGTGADALVGEVGQIAGSPTGDIGGALLPASVAVDGNVLADIGATGTLGDTTVSDGTHIDLNTPLHGAIA
jgi:hypothetical protein